jgi:integrase
VWSIRAKLQLERRTRDLALFNLAIDSKLRGCDLVALRVDDVAPNGYAVDRATVRQSKTGRPVRFELTEVTRHSLDEYLRATGRNPGQCLFPGRRGPDAHHAAVRPPRVGVGQRHRPRPVEVRHAFYAEDQSDSDLSENGQSACGATFVGAPTHRVDCALPRSRGRRRA